MAPDHSGTPLGPQDDLDLLIIGGGIGGVICLKYALEAGLRSIVVEKQAGVGGLWRALPAWQEIQSSKEEWTLGDLPIAGVDQASILGNIEAWVDRFGLAPHIRLNAGVREARPGQGGWEVETEAGAFRARFLIAATGGHNRPVVPAIPRSGSTIQEFHSTELRDPDLLRGKRVIVTGGGTSAWDLLDLCFLHGAAEVHWVYRSLKWMRPSLEPKHAGMGNRRLAQAQMLGLPGWAVNRLLDRKLRKGYARLGLESLLPDRPFDYSRDQNPPGRRAMLMNLDRIARHRGEVVRVEGGDACLADGERLKADLLLWGTGFDMDFSYLGVDALAGVKRPEDARARCGSLFRALDAPNLYLLAPGVLDTNASAPWAYAHAAKSIVADIRGGKVFGAKVARRPPQYFNLVRFLARRDRISYPRFRWRLRYLKLAFAKGDRPLPLP